jgi:hypothetical protein
VFNTYTELARLICTSQNDDSHMTVPPPAAAGPSFADVMETSFKLFEFCVQRGQCCCAQEHGEFHADLSSLR